MAIYKLTGVQPQTGIIDVDPAMAEASFLKMVNMNLFSLKDLLLRNLSVTNGPFKQWYIAQGYDWQNFLNIINAH